MQSTCCAAAVMALIFFMLSCSNNEALVERAANDTIYTAYPSPQPNKFTSNKKVQFEQFSSAAINSANRFYVSHEGEVYLGFEKGHVSFIFGMNRCEYTFPVIDEDNKIKVVWILHDHSCDYPLGLENNYGIKEHPVKGAVFAELLPAGDSAIVVHYLYPAFTRKQNEMARIIPDYKIDTIFPVIFTWANR